MIGCFEFETATEKYCSESEENKVIAGAKTGAIIYLKIP